MVFTLTAAMLIGTPMSASAAGLVDLYSISDGSGKVVDDNNPTGTITNTDTNTGFLTEDNRARIVGIALDKQTVNAEVGEKETLKATVVLEGRIIAGADITNAEGYEICKKDEDITDLVVAEMSKKIKWELMYTDAAGKKLENKPNPADKVGLELTAGNAKDRSMVTLTPYHGTKTGEEVTVRATIDASYYFNAGEVQGQSASSWEDRLETEKKTDKERDAFYTADAKVSVKEYSTALSWKGETAANTFVKHTLDLGALLVREPDTANDDIAWASSDTKVATVSASGVVTAKNVGMCKITAVGERGVRTPEYTINVEAGTPASKVIIVEDEEDVTDTAKDKTMAKQTVDLGKLGNDAVEGEWKTDNKTVYAKVFAKIKNVVIDKANGSLVIDGEKADIEAKLTDGTYKTATKELQNGIEYVTATKKASVWTVTERTPVHVTDVITWSSNKSDIVSVSPTTGSSTIMTAVGTKIGKASITAKASGGKSVKVDVTVKGTLNSLTIGGIANDSDVYSGQTFQLTDGRQPVGSTDSVKWSILTVNNGTKEIANPNATITNKGVLKIKNVVDSSYPIVIHLEASKIKVKDENGTEKPLAADNITVKPVQSSIDSITVKEVKIDGNNELVAVGGFNKDGSKIRGAAAISKTSTISIPLNKAYVATAEKGAATTLATDDLEGLLTWKSSNAKVAQLSDDSGKNVTIKAIGTGTATITVSGIRATKKNDRISASAVSVKFRVAVRQPAETLTMNKPSVTLAAKMRNGAPQNQNVALKVAFGPKKADKADTKIEKWTVKNIKTGDVTKLTKGSGRNIKDVTTLNATVTLSAPEVGDEYLITAKSITGMTATSTVKVVSPTQSVKFAAGNELEDKTYSGVAVKEPKAYVGNKTELDMGDTLQLYPYINIGANAKGDAAWKEANTSKEDGNDAYIAEGVTYSVNKKGIVTVDSKGTVYPIKAGKVTVTATTATGKKATLSITVK